jgi:hypothetical protein
MKPVRLITALAAAVLVTGVLVLPAGAPAVAAGDTLVVNAGSVLRPVTHVAAGGLYALASATVPTAAELPPLHLNQLVQPAPGVQQLGNGATVPTGDALKVAPLAIGAGAQEYVRMPDIYPNFPYQWVSWSDWLSKVDTMVTARLAATTTTNIDGWELWNEPDWTWNTAAAGSFDAGWVRTYQAVRALDSVTPIVGPSISAYNHAWMAGWLAYAEIEASSSASNGYYVGDINGSGDERSDSFVDFLVNVPTGGAYTMTIRYANGGTTTSTQGLAYDSGAWSTVSYPPTGSWGTFGATVATTVTLHAGSNVIRLAKGSPDFAGGTGYAELDSITLAPS